MRTIRSSSRKNPPLDAGGKITTQTIDLQHSKHSTPPLIRAAERAFLRLFHLLPTHPQGWLAVLSLF